MPRVRLTKKSRLTFHPLVEREEEGRYIIGRAETETYVRIPKVGYAIVYMLYHGHTIGDAEERYNKYNVRKFLRKLIHRGFVSSIDEKEYSYGSKHIVRTLFSWLKPRHARWLFQPSMYILYALIVLCGLSLMLAVPGLFPTYDDYFFIEIYSFLIPLTFVLGWLLVFAHEAGHFIAARSRAIPAEFGIGWRMLYLVAITRVTNLYSMERKKRYRIISAGIIVDALLMSASVILVYLAGVGALDLSPFIVALLEFFILAEFLGILWQFMFFMRTDIYYFFENLAKINNLQQKCRTYIKSWFVKRYRPAAGRMIRGHKEKWIVRCYSLFFIIGAGSVVFTFFYYSLPIAIELITRAVGSLLSPNTVTLTYIDSIIYLAFVVTNLSLMFYAIRKSAYKHHHDKWFVALTLLIIALNVAFSALMILLFSEVLSNAMLLSTLSLGILMLFSISALSIVIQARQDLKAH